MKEKQQLQQQLAAKEAELQGLKKGLPEGPERIPGQDDYAVNRKKNTAWIVAFMITLLVASGLAYALIESDKKKPEKQVVAEKQKPLQEIARYRVSAAKANFYSEADETTRRNAFIPADEAVTAYEDKNGFIYTEFTNSRGQTSKGWLRKQDLITPEEGEQRKAANAKPTEADIRGQLSEAAGYLQNNQVEDALRIYNFLTGFNVPDAMFGAANLSLQGKNNALTCDDAIALLKKSADVGHLPAKRTLGILYLFAENKAVLQINNYTQCGFIKNFVKGRTYLTEAANGGDTTARQLIDQLNISEQGNPPQ